MVRYTLSLAIACLAANAFAHHAYTEFDGRGPSRSRVS